MSNGRRVRGGDKMYKRNKNTGNDADDNVKRDRIKLKLDYLKFCNQMTCDDASVSKALTDLHYTFNTFHSIFTYFDIITTRFTSDTYRELECYKYEQRIIERQKRQNSHGVDEAGGMDSVDGNETDDIVDDIQPFALYGSMLRMPESTSCHKFLFVLEMNNTIDKIMGIGLVKNRLAKDQDIRIYDNPAFNKYIYKSDFHIPLINTEDNNQYFESIHPYWIKTMQEIEAIIFKGKGHLKRGGGFSRFPMKSMKYRHFKTILEMFVLINPGMFTRVIMKHFEVY